MKTPFLKRRCCCVGLAFVANMACGSGTGTTQHQPQAAAVEAVVGADQIAVAGSTLPTPLGLRARDAHGAPLEGVRISFAVESGGGTLSQPSAVTGSDGMAYCLWTVGTVAEAQSVAASAAGVLPVHIQATGVAGPATSISISATPAVLAVGGTTQLTAVGHDRFGNLASGSPTWSSADPGIATVSQTGLATGLSFGSVMLYATIGTLKGAKPVYIGNILAGAGTATIDGRFSQGEWDHAVSSPVAVNVPEGTTPGRLYFMNDATNLYVALAFTRSVVDAGNSLAFEFDSNGDGTLSAGDDGFIFNPSPGVGFSDLVRGTQPPCPPSAICSFKDIDVGGTNDGAGAFYNDGTTTIYEFRHPLNSMDPNDFALRSGSRIGFTMFIRLMQSSSAYQDTFMPGPATFLGLTIR